MKKFLKKFDVNLVFPHRTWMKYIVQVRHIVTIFGFELAILKLKKVSMNETHSGNLNRSKMPAKGEEGTCGTKSNDPEATLRKGSLPQASAVTTLPLLPPNKGEAIEEAAEQNSSLCSNGKSYGNVVPSGKNFPSTTGSGN